MKVLNTDSHHRITLALHWPQSQPAPASGVRLAIAGTMLCIASGSWAATGTATATAEVIGPITITDIADLSFGRFTTGGGRFCRYCR